MAPALHEPTRADGIDAQRRLTGAALRLFAERGFDKTSVREIARAAGVNVAAIGYYFGDKRGLYRALFSGPDGPHHAIDASAFSDPVLPARDALRRFFEGFLAPLRMGDQARLVMQLHFREMVDPTGLWREVVEQDIRPHFEALQAVLVRALGIGRSDDDVRRLAFAMVGMAMHFVAHCDGIALLAPSLVVTGDGVPALADRLAGFGCSMIEGERARRASASAARVEPEEMLR